MVPSVFQVWLNVGETNLSVGVENASLTNGYVTASQSARMRLMNLQKSAVSWPIWTFFWQMMHEIQVGGGVAAILLDYEERRGRTEFTWNTHKHYALSNGCSEASWRGGEQKNSLTCLANFTVLGISYLYCPRHPCIYCRSCGSLLCLFARVIATDWKKTRFECPVFGLKLGLMSSNWIGENNLHPTPSAKLVCSMGSTALLISRLVTPDRKTPPSSTSSVWLGRTGISSGQSLLASTCLRCWTIKGALDEVGVSVKKVDIGKKREGIRAFMPLSTYLWLLSHRAKSMRNGCWQMLFCEIESRTELGHESEPLRVNVSLLLVQDNLEY